MVIGGGVSGLAAAVTAAKEGDDLAVTVLEKEGDVGGRALSLEEDGWLVEAGPGGYLDTDPAVVELVGAAGIEQQQIRARASAARRFIHRGGRLHEVGPNLLKPLRSRLLDPSGLLRALGEPLIRKRQSTSEESIFEFCSRRFGGQIAERVVHTAMLGIFAGDARRLSVDACFPELRRLENEHGSVIRGGLARRLARRRDTAAIESTAVPSHKLSSFRRGLQQLPRALAADPRVEVRSGIEVSAIRPMPPSLRGSRDDRNGYVVQFRDGETLGADAVIVATPVRAAARLLTALAPQVSRLLDGIPVPPVAVVGLGFDRAAVAHLPPAFGVLVARGEAIRMLGCLWESHIYPGRGPESGFLLRVMLGGQLDPEIRDLHEEELVTLARSDLRSALGIDTAPVYSRVFRWPHAIPQYEIGHLSIREGVEQALGSLPGLFLAGDALEGVSFTKTAATGIRQGSQAARYCRHSTGEDRPIGGSSSRGPVDPRP